MPAPRSTYLQQTGALMLGIILHHLHHLHLDNQQQQQLSSALTAESPSSDGLELVSQEPVAESPANVNM